ncbi:MAG: elements of external origin [Candidatus Rokubacteria bacterium]|nr:elements of external origin [Candidatus Rokubacteria bacterium]
MGMTIRAYARHRGVDESTVRKALRAGRIAAEPDGTIDPAKADAAWAANTDAAKRPRRKAVPKAALQAARETLQESGQRPAGPGMTFMEARTASEVLKVQTARINLQRLKGELIDRARAVAHAFRFSREIRDAWLNWPARVSALMAAELGVEPHTLHTMLEKHVRQHLEELAGVEPRLH